MEISNLVYQYGLRSLLTAVSATALAVALASVGTGCVPTHTAAVPVGVSASPSPSVTPSSSPSQTWASTILDGGPVASTVSASSIATDSFANVYVAGTTNAALHGGTQHGVYDFFLTKYDATGARQWTVQDGMANRLTYGFGVAADPAGNAFVTGYTSGSLDGQAVQGANGSGWDFYITKYDTSGARQWTVQDGGSAGTFSVALGITADAAGNVFTVGFTSGHLDGQGNPGFYAYFVTRYDSSGVRQWTVANSVAGKSPFARGVAVDSAGYVYVTGNTNGAMYGQTQHASTGGYDFFLYKFSGAGALEWATQDGGTGSTDTEGYAVTPDTFGNVYVAGYTTGALDGGSLHGTKDFFLAKYNNGGGKQWTVQEGGASGQTSATGITADDFGRVCVSGKTTTAIDGQTQHGATDFFLTQYDLGGGRHWTVQNGVAGATVVGTSVAQDQSGNIYVAGYTSGAFDGQALHGAQDLFAAQYSVAGVQE